MTQSALWVGNQTKTGEVQLSCFGASGVDHYTKQQLGIDLSELMQISVAKDDKTWVFGGSDVTCLEAKPSLIIGQKELGDRIRSLTLDEDGGCWVLGLKALGRLAQDGQVETYPLPSGVKLQKLVFVQGIACVLTTAGLVLRYHEGDWLAVNWLNALPSKRKSTRAKDIVVTKGALWISTTNEVFHVPSKEFAQIFPKR